MALQKNTLGKRCILRPFLRMPLMHVIQMLSVRNALLHCLILLEGLRLIFVAAAVSSCFSSKASAILSVFPSDLPLIPFFSSSVNTFSSRPKVSQKRQDAHVFLHLEAQTAVRMHHSIGIGAYCIIVPWLGWVTLLLGLLHAFLRALNTVLRALRAICYIVVSWLWCYDL
ncbi:unnamed protein product [Albugo candida]|uniref:Transmembrane protein n=1 Tax=Albugo candida TaxID=65357 RepID=A0A024GRL0_9STRA|nr:unnamed protein product [Albugo candida]|eukprot:CCI49545.1 unnamed protein product [Albugo candida]